MPGFAEAGIETTGVGALATASVDDCADTLACTDIVAGAVVGDDCGVPVWGVPVWDVPV